MLVLERLVGERVAITVGDTTIWVSVHAIPTKRRVKLGFTYSSPVPVDIAREELLKNAHPHFTGGKKKRK